jgi:hypothetical protein
MCRSEDVKCQWKGLFSTGRYNNSKIACQCIRYGDYSGAFFLFACLYDEDVVDNGDRMVGGNGRLAVTMSKIKVEFN